MKIRQLKPIAKRQNELKVFKIRADNKTYYKGYVKKPFNSNILNSMAFFGLIKYSIKSDCRECLKKQFRKRF